MLLDRVAIHVLVSPTAHVHFIMLAMNIITVLDIATVLSSLHTLSFALAKQLLS